jgi:hypothetical protein
MYRVTADCDRFPSLHITTRQLERRRRNIRCIGFKYAKPFHNVHEIVEYEGGDKAHAWETRERNADVQWLVNRLAEIFAAAGARVELGGLVRVIIETAKIPMGHIRSTPGHRISFDTWANGATARCSTEQSDKGPLIRNK